MFKKIPAILIFSGLINFHAHAVTNNYDDDKLALAVARLKSLAENGCLIKDGSSGRLVINPILEPTGYSQIFIDPSNRTLCVFEDFDLTAIELATSRTTNLTSGC